VPLFIYLKNSKTYLWIEFFRKLLYSRICILPIPIQVSVSVSVLRAKYRHVRLTLELAEFHPLEANPLRARKNSPSSCATGRARTRRSPAGLTPLELAENKVQRNATRSTGLRGLHFDKTIFLFFQTFRGRQNSTARRHDICFRNSLDAMAIVLQDALANLVCFNHGGRPWVSRYESPRRRRGTPAPPLQRRPASPPSAVGAPPWRRRRGTRHRLPALPHPRHPAAQGLSSGR